jgi:NhaA family Na+:H+ antiporter
LPAILRILFRDEAIGGKLILAASVAALMVFNSPLRSVYDGVWSQHLTIGFGHSGISLSLREWVSQGLMAIFFLVVGLEIKREFIRGELSRFKTAALPIGGAIAGIVVPATIFLSINHDQSDALRGWAIPTATDTAFAIGVLSLLGRRVTSSLKIFLLTLAIVDDIGSIFVITFFYGSGLATGPLLVALAIAGFILLPFVQRRISMPLFCLLGLCFWLAIYKCGIHPGIAGVFIGFMAPLEAKKGRPLAERLEKFMIPVSTFVAVPLFAFTSLGIDIGAHSPIEEGALPLLWGIVLGLCAGKVLGISLAVWTLVRVGLCDLPRGTNWYQLVGAGFVAGIGFTVSLFVTDMAFHDNTHLASTAKLGVTGASIISAAIGYLFLRYRQKVKEVVEGVEMVVSH